MEATSAHHGIHQDDLEWTMLVLGRKIGEKILVPSHGIVFTILDVQGDKVRVGITAPPNVIIYRDEVWDRLQKLEAPPVAHLEGVLSKPT